MELGTAGILARTFPQGTAERTLTCRRPFDAHGGRGFSIGFRIFPALAGGGTRAYPPERLGEAVQSILEQAEANAAAAPPAENP